MAFTGSKFIEDDYLNIARNLVKGASSIHKFGAVPSLSINQTGTVWDVNDTLYPWTALDTPGIINIARANAADDGHVVTVQGLDENYNYQSENITIVGPDTPGVKLWRRINRAFCTLGGATNTGNIDVEALAPGGTIVARINAGLGQTLMSVYTIPNGYNGYIVQGVATVQSNADATGSMFVKYFGQSVFRVGHTFEVSGNGGQYLYKFGVPILIPAKSDIDVRANVRSNNARVTAAFDIILMRQEDDRGVR